MVPRSSDRISRVPPYLIRPIELRIRGCHPLWPAFPDRSSHSHGSAGPRSLATTSGVSVDFLSSGYLDVSVPRVRPLWPMYSASKYLVCTIIVRYRFATRARPFTKHYRFATRAHCPHGSAVSHNNRTSGGFPHSEIHGSRPVHGSPWLIAVYHVLHRLLLPRHPPNALLALDPTRKEQGWG